MAQTEDIELRDLVIEALEKNGSLAKIRALLRANIFLAFEDDCENIKQNECLDDVLKVPEGVLALSIIHEFLEFCNLKNTLFVYKSETRQGKEYTCKSQRLILETLKLNDTSVEKEPVLVTLIKNISNTLNSYKYHNRLSESGNKSSYSVHNETSSSTSHSQSDISSDEKNKIDLRLPLDNSDTDTSTDSDRNKYSSEYVPNKDTVLSDKDINKTFIKPTTTARKNIKSLMDYSNNYFMKKHDTSVPLNSSSESTSYVELKPFNRLDEKLLNTNGLPNSDDLSNNMEKQKISIHSESKSDIVKVLSSTSCEATKDALNNQSSKSHIEKTNHSDNATDYTFEFTSPTLSAITSGSKEAKEPQKEDTRSNSNDHKVDSINSPRSVSSASISDVADIVQSSDEQQDRTESIKLNNDKTDSARSADLKISDDSGDFSVSPIPSLSNLSLNLTD
ncbi:centrosomal protein 43-like [Leptidea sinapis]|uniref:centrosomal protein 43-like n=1 Tax=Leptidea sinapis TaxID=189913 RepID=UPI002140852A|nr:centrosomal protein 43-like [Leptidea sinapis]